MNKFNLISRLAFLALLFIFSHSSAQTSFNVSSNTAQINGILFDYSIGEMTLVTTESNKNLIITQGFLQPQTMAASDGAVAYESGIDQLVSQIKVYPNPTQDILFIETMQRMNNSIDFQLLDMSGKVILKKNTQQMTALNKYELNLSSFASGNYFLIVRNLQSKKEETVSFKIQKLH